MTDASKILRIGLGAAIMLLILQLIWHGWLAPAKPALFWPTLALAAVPLLPGLWVAHASVRRGVLIASIVCLFYFAHGVAELWSGARWFGAGEVALSLIAIGASGWDARGYKRNKRAGGA